MLTVPATYVAEGYPITGVPVALCTYPGDIALSAALATNRSAISSGSSRPDRHCAVLDSAVLSKPRIPHGHMGVFQDR